MLSKCFTGLLVHGTLPESMIAVVLVPIVKNKRASICSKSNYRPIALGSIVSTIFEKMLYDRISYALTTCSNQFGFKTKHSTDMCIYAFKEAVLKYRSLNSNVLGGCPFNGRLCVFEISPRNTVPIFADCPAKTLAGLTPPCSFPCLAGASWRFH